jgi:hypothetical protein
MKGVVMQIDRELAQQLFILEQRGELSDRLADMPEGLISDLARKGYLKVEHEWGEIQPTVTTTDILKGIVLSPQTFGDALKHLNIEE